MKKIYLLLISSLCLFTAQAQTVSTFENISLAANSYIDGRDSADLKGFLSGHAFFPTHFDTSFGGYWAQGFAISNKTDFSLDSNTVDYTKLYNCVKGQGANNSTNYAIVQNNAFVHLTDSNEHFIDGFYINNSNYTYLSMKWGDAIGKEFTDSDFLTISIIGFRNNQVTDTVYFKLADGKNLVNEWTWVDLNTLEAVDSIQFKMTSTDNGQFGMNTPGFFCIDDLKTKTFQSGMHEITSDLDISIYPNPTQDILCIRYSDNAKTTFNMMDATGKLILQSTNKIIDISALQAGIYFLQVETLHGTATKRFIKID